MKLPSSKKRSCHDVKHLRPRAQLYARHRCINRGQECTRQHFLHSKSNETRTLINSRPQLFTSKHVFNMPSPISTGPATGMTANVALPRYNTDPNQPKYYIYFTSMLFHSKV